MDAIEWEWAQFDQAELAHLVEGYPGRFSEQEAFYGVP
jgi:hypothetical protein